MHNLAGGMERRRLANALGASGRLLKRVVQIHTMNEMPRVLPPLVLLCHVSVMEYIALFTQVDDTVRRVAAERLGEDAPSP